MADETKQARDPVGVSDRECKRCREVIALSRIERGSPYCSRICARAASRERAVQRTEVTLEEAFNRYDALNVKHTLLSRAYAKQKKLTQEQTTKINALQSDLLAAMTRINDLIEQTQKNASSTFSDEDINERRRAIMRKMGI